VLLLIGCRSPTKETVVENGDSLPMMFDES
jgi:hypothetical protein